MGKPLVIPTSTNAADALALIDSVKYLDRSYGFDSGIPAGKVVLDEEANALPLDQVCEKMVAVGGRIRLHNMKGSLPEPAYVFVPATRSRIENEIRGKVNERLGRSSIVISKTYTHTHLGGTATAYLPGTEVQLQGCLNLITGEPLNPNTQNLALFDGGCTFIVPSAQYEETRTVTLSAAEIERHLSSPQSTLSTVASVIEQGGVYGEISTGSSVGEFEKAKQSAIAMDDKKSAFLGRLSREIAVLDASAENSNQYYELKGRLQQILEHAATVSWKEVNAGPVNDIPAFYQDDTVWVARGYDNHYLMLHEMGHHVQFKEEEEFGYFGQTPEDIYLEREQAAWKLNIDYVLFKAGYTAQEILELQTAVFSLWKAQSIATGEVEAGDPKELCEIAAGKSPRAFALITRLFDRIAATPDFTPNEIGSAMSLLAAHFQIEIPKNGIPRAADGDRFEEVLKQMYAGHLAHSHK